MAWARKHGLDALDAHATLASQLRFVSPQPPLRVMHFVGLRKNDAFRTMALAVEVCLNTILEPTNPSNAMEPVSNGNVRP